MTGTTTPAAPVYWPEEGTPDFVSDQDGEPGTWVPLCGAHDAPVRMDHRFTPWGSWRCPECGVLHLIWTEDWPDHDEGEDQ